MRKYLFLIIIIIILFPAFSLQSQIPPAEIKYQTWDMHALRYYPFKTKADSIIEKTMENKILFPAYRFQQISANGVINKQILEHLLTQSSESQNFIYKRILKPYGSWLEHAYSFNEKEIALPVSLFQQYSDEKNTQPVFEKTLFDVVGSTNIRYILDETLEDIDLWKSGRGIKSPLDKKNKKDYFFFLSSVKKIDSTECFEIVFYSQKQQDKALEGYLYISTENYSLQKAVFTFNFSMKTGRFKEFLFIQTPSKKEVYGFLGDEIGGSIVLQKTDLYQATRWDSIPSLNSESGVLKENLEGLLNKSKNTRAYRNLERSILFSLSGNILLGKFELGPMLNTISYNKTEGVRLRLGGYTSMQLNPRFNVGGYVAYGLKDEKWKFRSDLNYFPKASDKLSFSYIEDLNISGYDLFSSKRDNILYSIAHFRNNNMSLQKTGQVFYEKKLTDFSFRIGGRYLFDKPEGNIVYMQAEGENRKIIPSITSSELNVGLRFAPGEKSIFLKDRKVHFQSADFALELKHRFGIKNLLRSDYHYNATEFTAFQRIDLPSEIGSASLQATAGKMWNRVPFPLLFIPSGNHSYIFDSEKYNLMKIYEFVTDHYVAANLDMKFNWSPIRMIFPSDKTKITFGARTIYGPMSSRNDPEKHSELFLFNNGIRTLGNDPYAELNVGISNIFRVLRFDYVYRLNYGHKGGFFFTLAISPKLL